MYSNNYKTDIDSSSDATTFDNKCKANRNNSSSLPYNANFNHGQESNDEAASLLNNVTKDKNANNKSFFSKKHFWKEMRCWLPVLASMIFTLTAGSMHCFGNLTLYIASYLRMGLGENISYNNVQMIYAVQAITQGLATVLGITLLQTLGPSVASIFSGFILSSSLIISYYATSYRSFLLTYGVFFGLGNGLVYVLPLDVAMKWQPENKGIVTGLIYVSRGASVFLLSSWQTWFVNRYNRTPTYLSPENKEIYYIDEDILIRVPQLFLWMGICFAAIQLISAPLLNYPHKDDEHVNRKRNRAGIINPHLRFDRPPSLSIAHILSYKQFWALWLISFCIWQSVSFINGYWKVLGQIDFGISDTVLAVLGSLAAFMGTLGRLFWGYLSDLYGFKKTMVACCFGFSFFLFCIPLSRLASKLSAMTSYSIIIICLRLIDAGSYIIIAPETSNIFGENNFGMVFGLLYTARAIGSLVSANLISQFFSITDSGVICIIMAIFSFIAGLITLGNFLVPISFLPIYLHETLTKIP